MCGWDLHDNEYHELVEIKKSHGKLTNVVFPNLYLYYKIKYYIMSLQDIVYSKWMQQERKRQRTEISDDGASLVTFSKTGVEDDEIRIHNTFRLWITTQADSGRLIPGYYANFSMHLPLGIRNIQFYPCLYVCHHIWFPLNNLISLRNLCTM